MVVPRARGLDFQALQVPPASWGEATAIGPTATDGSFIVFFPRVGFKYLDLLAETASWRDGAQFSGSIDASFGILHHHTGDSSFISFAEAPPKSWTCYQLKDGKAPSAELTERLCLPGEIRAVCDAGDGFAALAVSSGQVRFVDLSTGRTGKGLKLAEAKAKKTVALARLAPRRVLLIRESRGSIGPEFLVVELDDFHVVSLQRRGTLHMGSISLPLGQLESLAVADADSERILLCWREPVLMNGSISNGHTQPETVRHLATATLSDKDSTLVLLPESSMSWHSVAGYYAEWRSEGTALAFHLREARYGLAVASGQAPWSNDSNSSSPRQPVVARTAGSVTLACAGSSFAAVKWLLSPFSLKGLVARRCAESRQVRRALDGGAAALRRKRQRDEESSERLTMPHLAELVRRCGALQKNDVALLKACLKPEDVQPATKILLSWLRIHQGLPAGEVRKVAPGMPRLSSIVRFLKALADAFMPVLVRESPDDIEAILERLAVAKSTYCRAEKLYARARAACRERPRASEVKTKKNLEIQRKLKAPKMEISVLKF